MAAFIRLLAVIGLSTGLLAQVRVATPEPGVVPPPPLPTLTARESPPVMIFNPPLPPTPPDVLIPDLGKLPKAPDGKKKSAPLRALERLAPNCLNWIFRTCWSSPPAEEGSRPPAREQEATRHVEVGEFYLSEKNLVAAESRFREALVNQPDHPRAVFRLAETLEKKGALPEARQRFQDYLTLAPEGEFAGKATDGVERLSPQAVPPEQ